MCHQAKFLRTGENPYEIVGTRLDDTNKYTQRRMHEHIGERAKMQRNKESQMGQHKVRKVSISSHRVEKCMHQVNQHHKDVFSQMVKSKEARRGTDANKQVCSPKDQEAQTHRGNKAWQEPRSRQTNMDLVHRSKQAYTCIKEMIQTL